MEYVNVTSTFYNKSTFMIQLFIGNEVVNVGDNMHFMLVSK